MTVQELGTVIRHGLAPTVIVVDNDGYTVERAIHGAAEPYNDIARLGLDQGTGLLRRRRIGGAQEGRHRRRTRRHRWPMRSNTRTG